MTCSICSSETRPYCTTKVLGKYNVQYYRCSRCQFIFTEHPYWLEEAYSSAITRLDIGLVQRNQLMTPVVKAVINKWLDPAGRFIDYGGGYGMLVRMMRDQGFNYYRQDIHCENLYANSFDVADVPPFKAELLTAFEVFEHLVDPVAELEKMVALSDTILFSTTVQPTTDVAPEYWWYFTPETGQHVSLYSRASLKALADRFGMNYCWNEQEVHLFSRKNINDRMFKLVTHPRLCHWYNSLVHERPSLLDKDFSKIKNQIKEESESID
jgi:hypothetical protein